MKNNFKHKIDLQWKTGFLFPSLFILCIISSCRKYVTIDNTPDQLLASQVFNNQATANNAIAGIYESSNQTLNSSINVNIYAGLSADELSNYANPTNDFQTNALLSTDATPWPQFYQIVYQCNSAVEGLAASSLPVNLKNQFLGEAKFWRAYYYLYLVNLYGAVPLITTTNVSVTANAPRASVSDVYKQIIADLLDAQDLLGSTNTYANGEKTRANKWVAKALLARAYLYEKDWVNTVQQSSDVIGSGTSTLNTDLTDVFKQNSNEAILQLALNSTQTIMETQAFLYLSFGGTPQIELTSNFMSAIEKGDLRKSAWIQSSVYLTDTINTPFKYTSIAINPPEYFMVLRLAEMYLIRAEAYAQQNKIPEAVADLNTIRKRAGLPNISTGINQAMCLNAILQERRIELFSESGHRWLDLNRTGNANAVLSAEKPGLWKPTAALWPIPISDIQTDPRLTQNPGYN